MATLPTLYKETDQFKDPSRVCAELVVFSANNPGNITQMFKEDELSLSLLRNMYSSPNEIANIYATRLKKVIDKYFPALSITVNTTVSIDNEQTGSSRIIVEILYPNGVPVIDRAIITSEDSGPYKINFQ